MSYVIISPIGMIFESWIRYSYIFTFDGWYLSHDNIFHIIHLESIHTDVGCEEMIVDKLLGLGREIVIPGIVGIDRVGRLQRSGIVQGGNGQIIHFYFCHVT